MDNLERAKDEQAEQELEPEVNISLILQVKCFEITTNKADSRTTISKPKAC
jgi:hypothetical protein